jgi:PKD repeat protein
MVLPRVVLCLAILLLVNSAASAQSVQTAFNSSGLTQLTYNGVTLVDTAAHPEDSFSITEYYLINGDGSVVNGWGGINNGVTMDQNAQTLTWSYPWGSVRCQYATPASGDRLNLTITVTNTSGTQSVGGINIFPFAVRFPQFPQAFVNPNYPQFKFNLDAPTVIAADYGNGMAVLDNEDASLPLYCGFFPDSGTASTNRYAVWIGSTKLSYMPSFAEQIHRPVAPGASDTYQISLRFAPSGSSQYVIAADIYQKYRQSWPSQLNWPDRRAIGELFLSTSADYDRPSTDPNPRGWIVGPNLDIRTPAGVAAFQQDLMRYADTSIAILKDTNAQGMITWDVEGQQYHHAYSYIGDPRLVPALAPEIDSVIDAYFKKFRDAGFKVGVTIRPQQFSLDSSGQPHQDDVSDPAAQIIQKIQYAKQRWNCTIFYVDSAVLGNGQVLDSSVFKRIADAFPDSVIFPEQMNTRHYAYAAGLGGLNVNWKPFVTSPDVLQTYPNAFTMCYVADGPVNSATGDLQAFDTLVAAVKRGDILSFRAWFDDSYYNSQVKKIYGLAHVNTPPAAALSVTPQSGTAPVSVAFDGRSSLDPDGQIVAYTWSFGDGQSASGPQVSHTYISAGTYMAVLTVTDNQGATGSASTTISVQAPNSPPSFLSPAAAQPSTASVGDSIAFSAAAGDPDGDALTYAWSFGDGASASGASVSHAYASGGVYAAVVSVSDGHGHSISSTVSVTVNGTASAAAYQIACGNGPVGSFAADSFFSGGATYSHGLVIDTSHISNPPPSAVYQSERFGNFGYTFPALSAGQTYNVRLHFAEIYWTAPNQRLFNVSINGAQVLANFDVFAAAGGSGIAIARQFSAQADSQGRISVNFTTLVDNAKVSAIEILPAQAQPQLVAAVDAGGNGAGAFNADRGFSGGSVYATSTPINTASVSAPQSVYQTERYGNFTYTFSSLTPGMTYTVRLHFAEIWWNSAGQRIFNVAINGQQSLANFDIFAAAGGNFIAIVKEFTTTADANGQIVIAYTTIRDNAKSSGIEIYSGTAASTAARDNSAATALASINLGTIKVGQSFKLRLDAPESGNAAKSLRWGAIDHKQLPPGVNVSSGYVLGKSAKPGVFEFQVKIKGGRTNSTTNTYSLTILP